MTALRPLAERIERAALADFHAAAPADARDALGLDVKHMGGALVSIAARDPSIVLNRAIGLADVDAVANIAHAYQDAGVARFFLHHFDEPPLPGLDAALNAAGLVHARGWMKFTRRANPEIFAPTDLTVREVGPDHGPDMGRIVAAGFDLSAAAAPALGALAGRTNWHVFMAFDGDSPAATGSLFVHGHAGWLDWGATDPAFRRRGAQSALLAARIRRAYELGCTNLFTATGEAVPGDPQHSYHNIERAGFAALMLRSNFQPRSRVQRAG